MSNGVFFGYIFVLLILGGVATGIGLLVAGFKDEEPAKLPNHDPYLIEMPHKYHFRNRWLRHKKGCPRCIQQAEIELGWMEAPKAPKNLGRGVGDEDDGIICM